MPNNNPSREPITKEEQTRRVQEAMRKHYRKLETDEEYRKKSEEIDKTLSKIFIYGADSEE